MITVRFPTGFSVQYNDLNSVDIRPNGVYLGKKSDPTSYYVWAPLGCIIEHTSPCRTYNAAKEESDAALKQQIEQLRKEVRSLTRKMGKSA